MSKRFSRMGWITVATLLCLVLIALWACGGGEEEEEITEYTLTISSTTGGSVTPAAGPHSYPQGTVVAVTATAAAGYRFVSWTAGPVADANDPTTSITMDDNYSIMASFEKVEVPVTTLTAATFFESTTFQSQMMDAFCDDLISESGGRLNFTRYWGGTLLGGPQLYDGAANGSVDIAMTFLVYTPGRFPPMVNALSQPLGIPSAWVATHVANDYYQKYKFGEFNDTHPLFFSGLAPLVMYTKPPVRTLADISGKIIRCGPQHNATLTALGATPSNIPMLAVYEGIQNGTIDGVMIGCDGFTAWQLGDVVKYTTFPYVAGTDVSIVTMSNKCWNSLPADLRQVFTDVSARYVDEAAQTWEDVSKASCDLGQSQGVEFITLSAAEKATWQTALVGVIPDWITTMVGKGYAQSDVEGWIDYIRGRIDYWTAEQIEAGIPFLVGYP